MKLRPALCEASVSVASVSLVAGSVSVTFACCVRDVVNAPVVVKLEESDRLPLSVSVPVVFASAVPLPFTTIAVPANPDSCGSSAKPLPIDVNSARMTDDDPGDPKAGLALGL